jgi:SAM-dependent methyltransferase
MSKKNIDIKTVSSFGDEWSRFDQSGMTDSEAKKAFDEYFLIFPWLELPENSEGFDMGCGSGRWAKYVAPRVGHLHCIDPSKAIDVARKNLSDHKNITFHKASVDEPSVDLNSQDFGYSLGVLHHVPDTAMAIRSCASLLKPGAPLLLYLYYAFDNRAFWFRALWRLSDIFRRVIHRLPSNIKHFVTDFIAVTVYWPLAKLSLLIDKMGWSVHAFPLSYYRHHTFYTMRTDARDRFGTPLEHRFTKNTILKMMNDAGFINVKFSKSAPYWCVVGTKNEI